MKTLLNLFVLFILISFCAPDLYALRIQKPLDYDALCAADVAHRFTNILTESGPFLMDIPTGDAESLRRYFDSDAWKKAFRSLTGKEREKVERDIADYFQLYENDRTLETWEKEGKQVKNTDIQAMKWPENADSYLIFYELFRKADAQKQNMLLNHILSRTTNGDFRGERFTGDCILLLLKNLPDPDSFSEKKDIVWFIGRLGSVFEFLQRHSYVLMSLSDAELEKMASSFEALEKELPIENIFFYEVYIRFIQAKKESPEAEAAYFEKTIQQCIEDYKNIGIARDFGKDAVVYDYLLRHPDQRAKYMDMFTDRYISEGGSGSSLFMLTWRLPYSVQE